MRKRKLKEAEGKFEGLNGKKSLENPKIFKRNIPAIASPWIP